MLNIERANNEIIIRLPGDLEVDHLQRMLDYLSYKQAIRNSKASSEEIEELSQEIKKGWWEKNKGRFPGLI